MYAISYCEFCLLCIFYLYALYAIFNIVCYNKCFPNSQLKIIVCRKSRSCTVLCCQQLLGALQHWSQCCCCAASIGASSERQLPGARRGYVLVEWIWLDGYSLFCILRLLFELGRHSFELYNTKQTSLWFRLPLIFCNRNMNDNHSLVSSCQICTLMIAKFASFYKYIYKCLNLHKCN